MKRKILSMMAIVIMLASTMIGSAIKVSNQENDENIKVSSIQYNTVQWTLLTDGFGSNNNFATRGIGIYNDELYIGTHNFNRSKRVTISDLFQIIKIGYQRGGIKLIPFYLSTASHSIKTDGGELWKFNYSTQKLTQIIGDRPEAMESSVGGKYNSVIGVIKEFKGKMYFGATSIYSYDGEKIQRVTDEGFGEITDEGPWSIEVFRDHIYIGTVNFAPTKDGYCRVWRSSDGENWTKVVNRGFRDFDEYQTTQNAYAWYMKVYKDYLYVSTYNHISPTQPFNHHKGGQLYRTADGLNWSKVELPGGDGFGKIFNYGIRTMEVYNDSLYVGTAGQFKGFEIWKYDGDNWIPVISDKVTGVKLKPKSLYYNGFGDPKNSYAFSMTVTSDNKLWVGTVNLKGAKLYCYDGCDWKTIVGDDENSEMPSGLGYNKNVGIRSLIEYPAGSCNLVIGTCNSFANPDTCQVWIRKTN